MERLIGRAVIHERTVFLYKEPFPALPIIAHTEAVAEPFRLHCLDSQREKMRDRDLAEAVSCFWYLDELLSFGVTNGF